MAALHPSKITGVVLTCLLAGGLAASPVADATISVAPGTNAHDVPSRPAGAAFDSDGDGLSDAFERLYGLNPHNPDTNTDGVLDPAEDPDHDLLSNLGEQRFHTSPPSWKVDSVP